MSDLRYAVRGLLRQKVFAATAILTLAIGIGANAAIWRGVLEAAARRRPVDCRPRNRAGRRADHVAAIIAMVALVACALPARRAGRSDPMTMLRRE